MQLAMLSPSTSHVRHRQAVQPASLHIVELKWIQPPQDSVVGGKGKLWKRCIGVDGGPEASCTQRLQNLQRGHVLRGLPRGVYLQPRSSGCLSITIHEWVQAGASMQPLTCRICSVRWMGQDQAVRLSGPAGRGAVAAGWLVSMAGTLHASSAVTPSGHRRSIEQ